MLRVDEVRRLQEQRGPEGYLQVQARLLGLNPNGTVPTDRDGRAQFQESVRLDNGREITRRKPSDFSIRALWEGLVGPVDETLGFARDHAGFVEMPTDLSEAVSSSAFPSAVGQLIATRVIEGFEQPATIGDQLVDDMPSQVRGERIVGFTTLQGVKPVEEGGTYEESSFGEKYVTSTETKRGRIVSVSEEAVFFDQTGQILRIAQGIGRQAAQDRERRIVRGVADVNSSERIYRPGGTAEQLYTAGNNNLVTTQPLDDWTAIQAMLTHHATSIRDDRQGEDGDPILWSPTVILTSMSKAGEAARLIAATEVRGQGTSEETISGNPLRNLAPQLTPLASPYLDAAAADADDDQYDDASDWFIGDPMASFIYKSIWPLQTFRAPAQNDEQFERDVVARFKVREYGDVNAVEHRLMLKGDAA